MITLYDLTSKLPGKAWSPNTFRVRIALNYKAIPFETIWLEYPEIEPAMKAINAKPTGKYDDGTNRDKYTVPVIRDDSTGEIVSDSQAIITYLDKTYPDTPKLIPDGCSAAIALYLQTFSAAFSPIRVVTVSATLRILNEGAIEFYRETREKTFGKKIEEIAPVGEKYEEVWETVRQGLAKFAALYDRNEQGCQLYFGEIFTFADVCLLSSLVYVMNIFGAESKEWKGVEECCEGRWERFLDEYAHLYST